MRIIAAAISLALLLPIPTLFASETPSSAVGATGDLASLLEGEFTTEPAPSDSSAGRPAGQHSYFVLARRLDVPSLGSDAVYAELRDGGENGKILRQRLYGLKTGEDGEIRMVSYRFANGGDLASSEGSRAPLARFTPSDPKPVGCPLSWRKTETGFDGGIPPLSCASAQATSEKPVMQVSKTGLALPVDSDDGAKETVFRRVR